MHGIMSIRRRHRWPTRVLLLISVLTIGTLVMSHLYAECESAPATGTASWQVYFSPHGGCTGAIVNAVGKAQKSIYVQAYSFTSAPIAQALVDAHQRGVQVDVILDTSQRTEKYSSADFLAHAGIPTSIDAKHAIAHNKVMVIDGTTVVTGSFNFTQSAEDKNAENLLVLTDPALAAQYQKNWQLHRTHSDVYRGR